MVIVLCLLCEIPACQADALPLLQTKTTRTLCGLSRTRHIGGTRSGRPILMCVRAGLEKNKTMEKVLTQ